MHVIARDALVDYYCPEGLKAGAKVQDSNDDCLVRLYLGKRRDKTTRRRPGPKRFFGLRNFPLCLDQMQDLGLDTHHFASVMAETLAFLHWKVGIDAADVEFVLGRPPNLVHEPVPSYEQLQEMRVNTSTYRVTSGEEAPATHLWLLDFNQCQAITRDGKGVDQAVKRFLDNDPYYPRPSGTAGGVEDRLWQAFKSHYLEASTRMNGEVETRELPILFIERLEEAIWERQNKRNNVQSSDMYSEFEAGERG